MGSGLSRYVSLRRIVLAAETKRTEETKRDFSYDFVIVDLPPSFGALVRAAFYSSDYYIVPCTSDNFSVYCVGLIGQMIPSFIDDWDIGLKRFKSTNPHFTDFDSLGMPVFAGWVFNGFDTTRKRRSHAEIKANVAPGKKKMVQADRTMHEHIASAIAGKLVTPLQKLITRYIPIANELPQNYRIGDIEDSNVLAQNSLWLSVPIGYLDEHKQVQYLRDRREWADNQLKQIKHFRKKFSEMATQLISVYV